MKEEYKPIFYSILTRDTEKIIDDYLKKYRIILTVDDDSHRFVFEKPPFYREVVHVSNLKSRLEALYRQRHQIRDHHRRLYRFLSGQM